MPRWCSPANHAALSSIEERQRHGFKSRPGHFIMKQLLSLQDCIKCGDCCHYHRRYLHLAPVLEKGQASRIDKKFLTDMGEYYRIKCPAKKSFNYFFCAFKDGNLCKLTENRSFECKLYPFNIMLDKNGNVVLGVDRNCRGIKDKTEKQIRDFARYLKPLVRKQLKTKKFYIEEFQPELEILEYL